MRWIHATVQAPAAGAADALLVAELDLGEATVNFERAVASVGGDRRVVHPVRGIVDRLPDHCLALMVGHLPWVQRKGIKLTLDCIEVHEDEIRTVGLFTVGGISLAAMTVVLVIAQT